MFLRFLLSEVMRDTLRNFTAGIVARNDSHFCIFTVDIKRGNFSISFFTRLLKGFLSHSKAMNE